MTDTEYLMAESQIRQLYARYADAVWRKDLDAFGDCYAVDCEWRIMGRILRGREEIVGNFGRILPRYLRTLFTFGTPLLEIADGRAESRVYVAELSGMSDGSAFAPIGTYHDRIVKQPDRWRFSWRLFQTQYAGPPDLSGRFFDNPEFGPPPNMPPLDTQSIDHTGAGK